jgi:hypothetical protein
MNPKFSLHDILKNEETNSKFGCEHFINIKQLCQTKSIKGPNVPNHRFNKVLKSSNLNFREKQQTEVETLVDPIIEENQGISILHKCLHEHE